MQMIATHFLYEFKLHNFFTLHISHLLDQVSGFQTAGHILLMDHEISLVGHYDHF